MTGSKSGTNIRLPLALFLQEMDNSTVLHDIFLTKTTV